SDTVSVLEPTAIYILSAPSTPEPVRVAVIERLERGDVPTATEVKQLVHAAKPKRHKRKEDRAKPARRASRAQRSHTAVEELVALQAEYAAWLETMPDAVRDGATGQKLETIVEFDLEELSSIEPPLGYGRD